MSDKHHKSSFTDVLFFIAIIAVVMLALGADAKFLSGIGKTVAAVFR